MRSFSISQYIDEWLEKPADCVFEIKPKTFTEGTVVMTLSRENVGAIIATYPYTAESEIDYNHPQEDSEYIYIDSYERFRLLMEDQTIVRNDSGYPMLRSEVEKIMDGHFKRNNWEYLVPPLDALTVLIKLIYGYNEGTLGQDGPIRFAYKVVEDKSFAPLRVTRPRPVIGI